MSAPARIKNRLKRHNEGRSKATKSGIPWRLVYTEDFNTRSSAYQRELQIKKMKSRTYMKN
jgi:putative endonuclease